jgi:CHAD domain-containing protein
MEYIQPDRETVAEGTARIAAELIARIGTWLADDRVLDDGEIHEIRKACKRLRALLRLIRPALTEHEFRETDRKVRKLASRLGQARDQAVMLATIGQLSGYYAPMLAADAFTPLREWVAQQAGTDATRVAMTHHTGALRLPLEELRLALAAIDLHAIRTGTLMTGLVNEYRLGRRALAEVGQQPDAEPVHALRRFTKYLFYQLTLVEAWDSSAIAPLIDLSHRVEEALGEVHDLSVLTNALHGAAPLRRDALRREVLGSLLETRWIRLLSGVLKQADDLYEKKPGKFHDWLKVRFGQE